MLADANRVSATRSAFHEAKHHLVYSLGRTSVVPRYVGDRADTTGDDALSAAEALVQEYLHAETAFAAFVASEDAMLIFPEARRLETAFKSVHMWLRAYQDALCGVLLALRGEKVGAYTSMSKALKPSKPLTEFLAEQLPDYEEWFRRWRARRDEMKLGASFRTVIDTDPPRIRGLSFVFPPRATSTEVEEGFVTLDDVIAGLDMSTRLTELVRSTLESEAKAAAASSARRSDLR